MGQVSVWFVAIVGGSGHDDGVSLCLSLDGCLSLSHSLSLSLSLCLSVFLSVSLCLFLSICLPVCLSLCFSFLTLRDDERHLWRKNRHLETDSSFL